jgi:hypothetical protein
MVAGGQSLGRFEVRLADSKALTFEMREDESGGISTRLLGRGDATLPLGMVADDDGLQRWLETRALPLNRAYADKLCIQIGIAPNDIASMCEVGRGLSLNDDYWIVSEGFDGRFADFNLFQNEFSDVLALVAYTGRVDLGSSPHHGLTPELTTGGSLAKAWRILPDGIRALYKGSTPGFDPGEWLSECEVSSLCDALGLRHVTYSHDTWEGKECSVCPCFCDIDTSYVPFAVATGWTDLPHALATCMAIGTDAFEELCDMLILDALTCNVDRHLTNFGFLLDAGDATILGLAPTFDNGRALFPNVSDADTRDASALSRYLRPAFGARTFERLASRVIGERQVNWLDRVAHADLDGVLCDSGASQVRAHHLSKLLKERAGTLLELEPNDRERIDAFMRENIPEAYEFAKAHGQRAEGQSEDEPAYSHASGREAQER